MGLVLLGKWAEYRAKVASLTTLASALYYGDSYVAPCVSRQDLIEEERPYLIEGGREGRPPASVRA